MFHTGGHWVCSSTRCWPAGAPSTLSAPPTTQTRTRRITSSKVSWPTTLQDQCFYDSSYWGNGIFVKSSLTGGPAESFLTHFFSTLLSMASFFHNGEQPNFLAFFRAFMRISYSFRKGRISMRSQNPLNKLRVRMLCCISTSKHSNALPFPQHL